MDTSHSSMDSNTTEESIGTMDIAHSSNNMDSMNNTTEESMMHKVQCVSTTKKGKQCNNTFTTSDEHMDKCYKHRHIDEYATQEAIVVQEHMVHEDNSTTHIEEAPMPTIEERLALLDPKTRHKVEGILKSFDLINSVEHNVDVINGATTRGLTGHVVNDYKPFNIYTLEANDYETRDDHWHHYFEVTKHMPILVYLGVVPSINDMDVSIDFTKAYNPDTAMSYMEAHPEISIAQHTTGAMFYMAAQIGKLSYDNNNYYMMNRNSAIQLKSSAIVSLFKNSTMMTTDGTMVELDTPGHMNVPSSMPQKMWLKLATLFGIDIHGAPSDNESITLAVSRRDTNKDFRIEQVMRIIANNGNAGKVYGKRQVILKNRYFAHIEYNVALMDPFLHPIATWKLTHGTIKVAVEGSPNDSADGAGFATPKRMVTIFKAIGLSTSEAKRAVRKAHVFHDNVITGFGFFKGNIILLPESAWRWDEEIDIVWDKASFSDAPLAPEHWDRAAFLFNPIKVNTSTPIRVANGEQLAFELLKVMAPEFLELMPMHTLNYYQHKFETKYQELLDTYELLNTHELEDDDFEDMDNDEDADAITTSYDENLQAMKMRVDKRNFFALANTLFASHSGSRPFAANMLAKIDRLLEELTIKGYCGLLAPMGACRITAGHYSPIRPDKGSLWPMKNEDEDLPWIVFVDDMLLSSPEFKWIMEFVDSDDSVQYMVLVDGEDYYVFLVKIPTSPNAGVIVPVSREIAEIMGTIPVPMNISDSRYTMEEIANQLTMEQTYQPAPLRNGPIEVTDNTSTMAYANQVAGISHLLGSMPRFSDLNTLASRSGLWRDLPRAQYLKKAFAQMSVAVDANVNKTETIVPMINALADNIIVEIHNGEGIDLDFLSQTKKQGLVTFLTRRYKLLRARHEIDSMETPMVDENGNISPNKCDKFDALWAAVAAIPKTLSKPFRKIAAILEAVSNGPISNYTTLNNTSVEAKTMAEMVWTQVNDTRKDVGLSWREREEEYLRLGEIVENALCQLDNYIPGSTAKLLAQHHAVADSYYSVGYRIHKDVPTGITTPVNEYLGHQELFPFFNKPSLPTVFMQVNPDNELTIGEDYIFDNNSNVEVVIRPKDNEITDEIFASVQIEEAATSRTSKAKEWGNIAGSTTMTFAGFVAWSLEGVVNGRNVDPVAIFVPNMYELLNWTV